MTLSSQLPRCQKAQKAPKPRSDPASQQRRDGAVSLKACRTPDTEANDLQLSETQQTKTLGQRVKRLFGAGNVILPTPQEMIADARAPRANPALDSHVPAQDDALLSALATKAVPSIEDGAVEILVRSALRGTALTAPTCRIRDVHKESKTLHASEHRSEEDGMPCGDHTEVYNGPLKYRVGGSCFYVKTSGAFIQQSFFAQKHDEPLVSKAKAPNQGQTSPILRPERSLNVQARAILHKRKEGGKAAGKVSSAAEPKASLKSGDYAGNFVSINTVSSDAIGDSSLSPSFELELGRANRARISSHNAQGGDAKTAVAPKNVSPWVVAEFEGEKVREDSEAVDEDLMAGQPSPAAEIGSNDQNTNYTVDSKGKMPDMSYSSSPKQVAQCVETTFEEPKCGTHAAQVKNLEAQIEKLKDEREDELILLRRDHASERTAMQRKLLKAEELTNHKQELMEKALSESRAKDQRIETLQIELDQASQRCTKYEETEKERPTTANTADRDKHESSSEAAEESNANAAIALEQALRERDDARKQKAALQLELDARKAS